MKYSIVMPYLRRAQHLRNTLVSFDYHYKDRQDYEVLIGEDIKNSEIPNEKQALRDVVKEFSEEYSINIRIEETYFPGVLNPCLAYNKLVKASSGELIVLTNPECFHKSNILGGLDGEFKTTTNVYVICACESAVSCTFGIKRYQDFRYAHHMWYQHSKYGNRMLHFCTAISRENYDRIGGFDESYQHGVSYDDDDFRETVKASGIPIRLCDDLHVVHIDHDRSFQIDMRLTHINIAVYKKKWNK